jgi:hypothetical protein
MSRLEEIRDRLRQITAQLEDPEVSDGDAGKLAAEAAELTAEAARKASGAVDRLESGS